MNVRSAIAGAFLVVTHVFGFGDVHAAAVEFTLLDADATGYATFQSHNQKVVSNPYGIFTTHIRKESATHLAQTWRLSRSRDGGKTFTTVFEATHATKTPVIETDAAGNVYLLVVDYARSHGPGYLYRFLAARNFADPQIATIPLAADDKYSMVIDEPRGQLHFLSKNSRHFIIGLDGTVRSSRVLFRPGVDARLAYPHLALDTRGNLHAAWTTQKHNLYLYWDIHHMYSPDGGTRWRTLAGAPIVPPVIVDQHGPTTRITLDDEFNVHTWLSSSMPVGDQVHFLYLAQSTPPRQHYVRYSMTSGAREADVQPEFKGETLRIQGLDGFFTAERRSGTTMLYAIAAFEGKLVCLVSRDNGRSWQDVAQSEQRFRIYALGGAREITKDGYIIGTFTDLPGRDSPKKEAPKVYFFRIKVG